VLAEAPPACKKNLTESAAGAAKAHRNGPAKEHTMPIWETVAELKKLNQALEAGHVAAARRIVRKALAAAKAQEAALQAHHAIASILKEGQLHLALTLAALAENSPHHSVRISTRDLSKAAHLSESALPAARKAAPYERRRLAADRRLRHHDRARTAPAMARL
jgi:hypothetical protein